MSEVPALRHYFDIKVQLKQQASRSKLGSMDTGLNGSTGATVDKESLLAQVRKDNAELGLIEKKMNEVREQMAVYQAALTTLPSDAGMFFNQIVYGWDSICVDQEVDPTFQQLSQKESEIQQFLDSFPLQKEALERELNRAEQEVENLLANMEMMSKQTDETGLGADGKKAKMDAVTVKSEDWVQLQALEEKVTGERAQLQRRLHELTMEMRNFDQVQAKKFEADAAYKVGFSWTESDVWIHLG